MTITPYLAMTAAEMKCAEVLPDKVAWMACHFSLYSTGLSNIPQELPPGSMLIVNDIIPMNRHDPDWITEQLIQCVQRFQCSGVLLDFQRSATEQACSLAQRVLEALPCPVAAAEPIAANLCCAVFLPPCPLQESLEKHLAPWRERDIWLEIARQEARICIDRNGSSITCDYKPDSNTAGFQDHQLNCHYSISQQENGAEIMLWQTAEDLEQLVNKAAAMDVSHFIGLYQELG